MSVNSYLNLRFINIIEGIRTTPYTAAELYSSGHTRNFTDVEDAGRLLRMAKIDNLNDFEKYLISLRDVNAWKIGVFKFFYSYYKTHPEKLLSLSVKDDAYSMEKFIDDIDINPNLANFYEECGHDAHLALKYSVSKIICDEKRLGWMHTFCGKFINLLALGEDTGVIALTLVRQLDLVESALGLGIITLDERNELIIKTGKRIVDMFGSWGRFLAGVLLSHLYEICLSTAEIKYLPKKAQELLDGYYLCCNNDIHRYLKIDEWKIDDIKEFKCALRPLVDYNSLDALWNSTEPKALASIQLLSSAFYFYQNHIHPNILELKINRYFREFGKYDEFIPVINGFDFKIYFESLKLPLALGELPLFIMRFNMFTTHGVWSFGPYKGRKFVKWPKKLEVEVGGPCNRGYGNMVMPFCLKNVDSEFSLQVPTSYCSDLKFLHMTQEEQLEFLAKDISGLTIFFENLPHFILSTRT